MKCILGNLLLPRSTISFSHKKYLSEVIICRSQLLFKNKLCLAFNGGKDCTTVLYQIMTLGFQNKIPLI